MLVHAQPIRPDRDSGTVAPDIFSTCDAPRLLSAVTGAQSADSPFNSVLGDIDPKIVSEVGGNLSSCAPIELHRQPPKDVEAASIPKGSLRCGRHRRFVLRYVPHRSYSVFSAFVGRMSFRPPSQTQSWRGKNRIVFPNDLSAPDRRLDDGFVDAVGRSTAIPTVADPGLSLAGNAYPATPFVHFV